MPGADPNQTVQVDDGYIDSKGRYFKIVGQSGDESSSEIYELQPGTFRVQETQSGESPSYTAVPTQAAAAPASAPAPAPQKSFEERRDEAVAAERARITALQNAEREKELGSKRAQAASEEQSLGRARKLSTATVLGNRKQTRRNAFLGLLADNKTRGSTLLGVS